MIRRDVRGKIAVLRLEHGKANAMSAELLEELQRELDDLSGDIGAVILTGTGGMFSAGVDLPRFLEEGRDYASLLLAALDGALESILRFPHPIVAAINGHAIAGGFVMACACDLRLMADGAGKLGLTELAVGVPFPGGALEIVRFAIGTQRAREMIYGGRLYSVAEAERRGLVDEIVESSRLLERSLAVAGELAAIPRPAFELSKSLLLEPLRRRVERLDEERELAVSQAWQAEETHAAIRRFVAERLG